ncbi:hypothetical protein [Tritonibacter sp. SIMBA_163]|uniref:hypothetical protein n=1 Tax=Tritonibacter sp. SIMBA_163 TaxID=3080868 RepID=UPI0039818AD7
MRNEIFGHFNCGHQELEDNLPASNYDYVLTTISWETRSNFAFSKLDLSGASVVAFRFCTDDERVEAKKDTCELWLRENFTSVSRVDLQKSVRVDENFATLKEEILDLYRAKRRPLKVLVNITCLPKAYVLFLLGLCMSADLVLDFDCLYAPGKYDLTSSNEDPDVNLGGPRSLVSLGKWTPVRIPYLSPGEFLPPNRDLIVSVGGEIGHSLPLVRTLEPRNVFLVYISESAPSDEREMHASERVAYEELKSEPNTSNTDLKLHDAIGVCSYTQTALSASGSTGVTAMAIGSKSHALGLGIAALCDRRIEVVCRIPTAYAPLDVEARGDVHFFRVRDRFEPLAYVRLSDLET